MAVCANTPPNLRGQTEDVIVPGSDTYYTLASVRDELKNQVNIANAELQAALSRFTILEANSKMSM